MKRLISILLLQTLSIAAMFAQVTFKPTSATISDSQGTYTSQQFDCGNMVVTDNKTAVLIYLAGNKMKLSQDSYNKDTYISTVRQGDITIKAVAYRSSNSNKIYLIVLSTKQNDNTTIINFKP